MLIQFELLDNKFFNLNIKDVDELAIYIKKLCIINPIIKFSRINNEDLLIIYEKQDG